MENCEPNVLVNTKQLKQLLFSNVCASRDNELELIHQAQNRLFNRCFVNDVFSPTMYKALWNNVHLILKDSKMYEAVNDVYNHFNPLGDYDYDFLGEYNGEYAILYTR